MKGSCCPLGIGTIFLCVVVAIFAQTVDCYGFLMLSSGVRLGVGWCVRLPEVLFPLVSHCLPTYVCLCWMARPPSQGLVSPCLPLSPIASPHVCLCWMARPPSQCVGWCARLPKVLSPLVSPSPFVSHYLHTWVTMWMVCPPSRGLVSTCLPTCVPVLDGVAAFPKSCLPLSPIVAHVFLCWNVFAFPRSCLPIVSPHMRACVGCCVCLSKFLSSLASHCLPIPPIALIVSHCLPHMCACVGWCVRLPEVCLCWSAFPSSCLLLSPTCVHVLDDVPVFLKFCLALSPFASQCFPLSRIVSLLVFFCWMVCPPSGGLVSPLVSLCWMVCPPFRGLVSPCLPSHFPLLDGLSAFPRSCLPLSPHMCACVGWCVRLPKVLSTLVSHCLPTWVPVLLSAFPKS